MLTRQLHLNEIWFHFNYTLELHFSYLLFLIPTLQLSSNTLKCVWFCAVHDAESYEPTQSCTRPPPDKVLCVCVLWWIQVVMQFWNGKYNADCTCVDIMQAQIIALYCSALPFVSGKQFAPRVKLASIQCSCNSLANVMQMEAYSITISFVICSSFLRSVLWGIGTTKSAQIYHYGMMEPHANITLHVLISSGWALWTLFIFALHKVKYQYLILIRRC